MNWYSFSGAALSMEGRCSAEVETFSDADMLGNSLVSRHRGFPVCSGIALHWGSSPVSRGNGVYNKGSAAPQEVFLRKNIRSFQNGNAGSGPVDFGLESRD